jgi:hypothetical protein
VVELFEEGVEIGVLAVGLVADLVGLGIGFPLEPLFLVAGLGEGVADLLLGRASRVPSLR